MAKTRAVLFDLYGVLGLNGWQAFKLKHFANNPEDWEHLRALGQRVDAGLADQAELVQAIAHATGETESTVRFQFEHTTPNTQMLQYIEQNLFGRYKLGVLSNASSNVFGTIFTTDQLQLFDATVSSYHIRMTKPDPGMFTYICKRLEVDTEECLFVDDQERHVEAARALGMKTVLYEDVAQTIAALERTCTT